MSKITERKVSQAEMDKLVAKQFESEGAPRVTAMDEAYEEFWRSLSRAGDPARIPNKVRTGFNAGWEAYAQASGSAQRWIPVSERLPEKGTCALIWMPDIQLIAAFNADETWTAENDDPLPVTHWMSLPQPPTEER
jgi:hypothetical protein